MVSERMEELLCDASMRGDLKLLREIIAEDNYILYKVLVGSFKGKNPLHVATSTGKREFVQELLKIEPKLAKVVDTELGTPLHIASANGHVEIVKTLVQRSPEMCMARDRDGYNPLHIAAMEGKDKVLKELVQTCPRAARVILDRGDTILHLCVNYNQLKSLQLLLEMIKDPEFVESKDANGNTLLHLAVFGKHHEIVKCVAARTGIYVNTINGAGWTALDICFLIPNPPDGEGEQVDVGIKNFLRENGAKRRHQMAVIIPSPRGKELMQTLMVVSSLFATMAFQVGVNPPGGVWQDDSEEHLAGKSILAYKYPKSYSCFMYFNTVGFLLSSFLILFLLVVYAQLPKRRTGWLLPVISLLTIMTTAFAYTYSIIVVSPKHMMTVTITISLSVILWAFAMILLAVKVMATHERARSKDRPRLADVRRPTFADVRRPTFADIVLQTAEPISSSSNENPISAGSMDWDRPGHADIELGKAAPISSSSCKNPMSAQPISSSSDENLMSAQPISSPSYKSFN